jgi:hypothetical protein
MMFEILSNAGMFKKFLQYAAITPIVFRVMELVEPQKLSGEKKREKVVKACIVAAEQLARRQYIPASALEGIDRTAADVTDMAVAMYNAMGLFKTSKKPKESEKEEG